jgi:predicted RNA-binding Zn ribbon-like protein
MQTHSYPSYAVSPPKLVAGALGLDFLNTVEWRGDPDALSERLTSYAEFVIWCEKAGLLDAAQARELIAQAKQHPRAAAQVLRGAIALREAAAAVAVSPGSGAAVARLNVCLSDARFELHVERGADGHLRDAGRPIGDRLRRPLDLVAREIVAALTSERLRNLRTCCNERCGWIFIDSSRNGARRWCQMATCGNRTKARAHYARHKRNPAAHGDRD